MCRAHCACHAKPLPNLQKGQFLRLLTFECAWHHNGAYFFNISTSKSGPRVWCFWHFTSKFVSRHSGAQFLISHPVTWLRTRRFLLTLFLLWTSFFAFLFSDFVSHFLTLLTLPTTAASRVHIVGSLTSKHPSAIRTFRTTSFLLWLHHFAG